jgi:formate C-acetyltransferase
MTERLEPSARNKVTREAILSGPMRLGVERATLWSEGEGLAGDAPPAVRNALAFEHLCENTSLIIRNEERIAGNKTEHLLGIPWFVERGDVNKILATELKSLGRRRTDRLVVSREEVPEVKRLLKLYEGRSALSGVYEALYRDGVLKRPRLLSPTELWRIGRGLGLRGSLGMTRRWVYPALRSPRMISSLLRSPEYVAVVLNGACGLLGFQGHVIFGHNNILENGYDGIAAEAGAYAVALDPADPDKDEKLAFYESVGICCRAARGYAFRLADRAEMLACATFDESRSSNLVEMAGSLRRVAGGTPESFRDAVQLLWLSKLLLELYHPVSTISLGRVDRMLYPYYKADVEGGRTTPGQARDLLEELLLKVWTCTLYLGPAVQEMGSQKFTGYQALTVGGTDEEGNDLTSDLTFLLIDALDAVRPVVNLCVRVHPNSPPRLMERVVRAIGDGVSLAVYNDEVYSRALERLGVSAEHARDYAIIGCVEQVSASRTGGNTGSSQLNLAALVDMAVRNGSIGMPMANLLSGGSGCVEKEFRPPSCFEELIGLFERQLDHAIDDITRGVSVVDREYLKWPTPFISMTIDGCLESGSDITAGGATYDVSAITLTGMANAVDSLMAIKRAVYDEGWVSLEQLMEALDVNFRGHEDLRRRIINRVPKFGNDNDEVDGIARRVMDMTFEKILSRKNMRGGRFTPAYISLALHIVFGQALGATPDGRLAGTPICNSFSPVNGMDRNGPTATLNSVTRIDTTCFSSGVAVNIKVNPLVFEHEGGRRKLADLILAYFEKGGPQLQVTVADAEMLRDAKRHPEEYPSLVVKVGGYSALFSDLGPDIQDDIIERTEHVF